MVDNTRPAAQFVKKALLPTLGISQGTIVNITAGDADEQKQ